MWGAQGSAVGLPRGLIENVRLHLALIPKGLIFRGVKEEMNSGKMGRERGGPGDEPGLHLAGYPLEPRHTIPKLHIFIFPLSSFCLSV